MEELLYKLLEQTPTIIALGVGIFALWKEKSKDKKEWIQERKTNQEHLDKLSTQHQEILEKLNIQIKDQSEKHNIQIERINTEHKSELKELNEYVRNRESEHIQTIRDLITISEDVEKNQERMMVLINELNK